MDLDDVDYLELHEVICINAIISEMLQNTYPLQISNNLYFGWIRCAVNQADQEGTLQYLH